jgi:hypothetical protein
MLDLDLDTDPTQGLLAKHLAMNIQGHVEDVLKIYIHPKARDESSIDTF